MHYCAHCNHAFARSIYRNTVCESCGKDLKTCRNCRHYSPGMSNDCREPVSELVQDKDRANFCDWFSASQTADLGDDSSGADRAKKAFSDLFNDD